MARCQAVTADSRDQPVALLAFDANNRLAVRSDGPLLRLPFVGADPAEAQALLEAVFQGHTPIAESFETSAAEGSRRHRVFFARVDGGPARSDIGFRPIGELEAPDSPLDPVLRAVVRELEAHLIEIAYLHLGENDFIYRFRPEKERNSSIYVQDAAASGLYQSRLCAAIKELARRHERSAGEPVELDFGIVRYLIPSHFGFCLGVKNAIERAYETLAENPGRRVFMLSELIHNPFVNEDLRRRGLKYLQSDKGKPFAVDGTVADGKPLLWDSLTPEDVVIIPAFGATDEDKRRLVRKGLAVATYDATCMLVEKVWKAARAYGRAGYTVVIHGKHEHEETKSTFSNTRRYAQAVIVRNMEEARRLGQVVTAGPEAGRAKFHEWFAGKHTPGFDVERHLKRVAVVNQTTLLMNETREIIEYLRDLYASHFGPDAPGEPPRVGGSGRNDTLCYATQVNQDALARALAEKDLDAAFVVGGRNSSNTYQLHRLCEQRLGPRAFFIQSEADIRSFQEVEHSVFPAKGHGTPERERRSISLDADDGRPRRILVTGGASCPDGIIQQVVTRINGFFPPDRLRSPEEVLEDLRRG